MSGLIDTYLEKREALVRFFTLRLGSPARAEDLVQDIYLKISGFTADEVEAVRNPAAFLYRLGSNLMLDRLKQSRRSLARDSAWARTQGVEAGGEGASDTPSAEDAVDARQRLARVIAALEGLSPPARQAFRLHKLEGLTQAETAERMGISKSGVEKHIAAALKHLLKQLE